MTELTGVSPRPWLARAPFLQRAAEQGLDNGLTANVESDRTLVEFAQHALCQVDIHGRTGLTTVNLLVKYEEISSPRVALSAISSAEGVVLNVFGIAFLFFFRGFPGL